MGELGNIYSRRINQSSGEFGNKITNNYNNAWIIDRM